MPNKIQAADIIPATDPQIYMLADYGVHPLDAESWSMGKAAKWIEAAKVYEAENKPNANPMQIGLVARIIQEKYDGELENVTSLSSVYAKKLIRLHLPAVSERYAALDPKTLFAKPKYTVTARLQ